MRYSPLGNPSQIMPPKVKRDVRDQPYPDDAFDYAIACSIFTVKHDNTYAETVALAEGTLRAVWPSVTEGLGFNSRRPRTIADHRGSDFAQLVSNA